MKNFFLLKRTFEEILPRKERPRRGPRRKENYIILCRINPPILRYPKSSRGFLIHKDATILWCYFISKKPMHKGNGVNEIVVAFTSIDTIIKKKKRQRKIQKVTL